MKKAAATKTRSSEIDNATIIPIIAGFDIEEEEVGDVVGEVDAIL